jgi:hypothetical protein
MVKMQIVFSTFASFFRNDKIKLIYKRNIRMSGEYIFDESSLIREGAVLVQNLFDLKIQNVHIFIYPV